MINIWALWVPINSSLCLYLSLSLYLFNLWCILPRFLSAHTFTDWKEYQVGLLSVQRPHWSSGNCWKVNMDWRHIGFWRLEIGEEAEEEKEDDGEKRAQLGSKWYHFCFSKPEFAFKISNWLAAKTTVRYEEILEWFRTQNHRTSSDIW